MLTRKHRVYEGVLTELGPGTTNQGDGGRRIDRVIVTSGPFGPVLTSHTIDIPPRDAYNQIGFILRENVDIGGTRIRNVSIIPQWDVLLREAMGQDVALSVVGAEPGSFSRHTIAALRTPTAGVVRMSRPIFVYGAFRTFLKYWLLAPVAFIGILIAAAIAGKIFDPLGKVGFAVAVLALLYYLVIPFLMVRSTRAANNALGSKAGGAQAQLQT